MNKRSAIPKAIRHLAGLQRAPIFAPGVYFLIDRGEVVYVGQSISPTRRIGDHISEGVKKFDDVYVMNCPRETLDHVEASFIELLRPRLNVAEGRAPRASHESERTVDMLRALTAGLQRQTKGTVVDVDKPEQRDRLLRLPEVVRQVGLGKSSIYKMMSEGKFPNPVRLGVRSVAWKSANVDAWIASMSSGAATDA